MERKKMIESAVKTFPVSYYLKREAEVKQTHDRCSSYDPMSDSIKISIPQIEKALANVSDADVERFARSNFYHEVSHAMLTPVKMAPTPDINIVEDERIETVNSSTFIDVDFDAFKIAANGDLFFRPAKDEDEAFYKLVRFHQGSDKLLTKLSMLLSRHAALNRISPFTKIADYIDDIRSLRLASDNEFNAAAAKQDDAESQAQNGCEEKQGDAKGSKQDDASGQSGESQTQKSVSPSEEGARENGSQQDVAQASQKEGEAEEPAGSEAEAQIKPLSLAIDKEHLAQIALKSMSMNELADAALEKELERIIMSHRSSKLKNGAALAAYSGVIDPRLTDRADCRFFVQKSREGHLKHSSKLHLVFCQDVSASYENDVLETNRLFYALQHLEAQCPDFEFDVVTVSNGNIVLPKSQRMIKAAGGTCLHDSIFGVMKQMRKPDAEAKFIVLFDGSCAFKENFRAFDSRDVSVIYEQSNYDAVRYCPNAKLHLVEGDFAKNLRKVALACIEEQLR